MTREEAIRELREDKALYETDNCHAGDGSPDGDLLEALDMAIEVLSVKDCHGCTHYDLLQTPLICHDCSRSYKDRYKDEKGTLDDMFTESAEAYKAWTGEEMGRPHGEWIVCDYDLKIKCPICGETFNFDDVDELLDYKEYAKYCLACGADMKGGDNE